MKVLFISSGNSKDGISPIVKKQGESLINQGIHLEYFTIKGKGYQSYIKHIFILRKCLKENDYQIVHAHYSFSAFVASLAGSRNLVVSLMGSDIKSSTFNSLIIRLFYVIFSWKALIVKSEEMRENLRLKNVKVIPNGVDFTQFQPLDKLKCQSILGWNSENKHILFAADPARPEKNFKLAREAFDLLDIKNAQLHVLESLPHEQIPVHMNAADVILLTSLWEGSPNVIKEAMACCRPVVCTDVGDVKWLSGDSSGHFIVKYEVEDLISNLKKAIEYSCNNERTKGRDRIIHLELDVQSIAKKFISVYENTLI